jgi:hypothetical protein
LDKFVKEKEALKLSLIGLWMIMLLLRLMMLIFWLNYFVPSGAYLFIIEWFIFLLHFSYFLNLVLILTIQLSLWGVILLIIAGRKRWVNLFGFCTTTGFLVFFELEWGPKVFNLSVRCYHELCVTLIIITSNYFLIGSLTY